jgi:hypothetical protein
MRRCLRRPLAAALACTALGLPAGCATPGGAAQLDAASADVSVLAGSGDSDAEPVDAAVPVAAPGRLAGRVQRADLVVAAPHTLSTAVRRRVSTTDGVTAPVVVGMAAVPVKGRMVTLAAVDPTSYRRFTPEVTARADAVWERVAHGDLAISPELAEDLGQDLGADMVLGNGAGSLTIRVGARASMPPKVDAVVNEMWGRRLGMVADNAVLVSTGTADPAVVAEALRRRVGARATVSPLTAAVPTEGRQTAFLTGGSVAAAVGSFRYRYFPDGTVEPDPAWVAANIRTEPVPILGAVTCHRVLLPQLRGALQEVADRGLADRIDPGDFGGCYAPRFIARDPAKGLSLHTWGIAVDLNVQGNLRGTVGAIDRRVVDVFKRWGFAWGGDWSYTDPMHFELAALVGRR